MILRHLVSVMRSGLRPLVILVCLMVSCTESAFQGGGGQKGKSEGSESSKDELGQEADGGELGGSLGGTIDPQIDNEFEPADKPGMVSGAMLTCVSLVEPERDPALAGFGCSVVTNGNQMVNAQTHRIDWSVVDEGGNPIGQARPFTGYAPFHIEVVVPKEKAPSGMVIARVFWRGWQSPETLTAKLNSDTHASVAHFGVDFLYQLGNDFFGDGRCEALMNAHVPKAIPTFLEAPFSVPAGGLKVRVRFAVLCGISFETNMVYVKRKADGQTMFEGTIPKTRRPIPFLESEFGYYETDPVLDLAEGEYVIEVHPGKGKELMPDGTIDIDDFLVGNIFIIGVR